MKKYRSLFAILIVAYAGLLELSLFATDIIFYPPAIVYRDPGIIYRDSYMHSRIGFGDHSNDGVFYLIVKTIIDSIDHKKFCCALLGMLVAVLAHSMWQNGSVEHHAVAGAK